jgi:CubicO group peptidase (beta-lactamase class C family)
MGKLYKVFLVVAFASILIACKSNQSKHQKADVLFCIEDSIINLDDELISEKSLWIDSIFQRLHKRNGFTGAILYAERGNLVYKNGFGYGDIRKKIDINTKSAFQLASVSKMFTAIAVMILFERGDLEYDIDIRKYISEFPYENITARLLMNHRSGLGRYMSLAHDHWKNKRIPLTNEAMLQLFVKYKPTTYFSPNSGFHYCNTNYALLANIVERISKQPFDEFVKENIFVPLKMNNSFVYNMNNDLIVSAYITKGIPGYRYKGYRPIRQRNEYLNGVMGDKGVYSSVEDLFKFDQALNYELLVSKKTLAEAFKSGSPKSRRRRDNYGFGWRIKNGVDSTVYHYGWWKGFRAFYIRDMKQEKTIIVLSNREKGVGSSHFWSILKNKKYDLPPVSWLTDSIR